MLPLTGRQLELDEYPQGELAPRHFRIVEAPVRPTQPGEVLVRNTWTSVDAGLRLRLRPAGPSGYSPASEPPRPLDGIMTVGELPESRAAGFAAGDAVWHALGWRDYAVVRAGETALGGLATLPPLGTALVPARGLPGAP